MTGIEYSIKFKCIRILIIFITGVFSGCSDMLGSYNISELSAKSSSQMSQIYSRMMVNNNESYTYSRNAVIQLNITSASEMQFSDDGTIWTAWEPYSGSKTWTLKLGTGAKTIQAKIKKTDNSIITLSDDIVFCERLIASDGVVNDISESRKEGYGENLVFSSDGKILAAGHEKDMLGLGHYTGSVYIYRWNIPVETWIESKIIAADNVNCRSFGRNISLSADGLTIAVSDQNNISGSSVYIFKWDGSAWNQVQKIIQPHFSIALSGNGNTLVIGDSGYNPHNHPPDTQMFSDGAIWIYEYNGSTYNGVRYSSPTGDQANGYFVAISSDSNTVISIPVITTSVTMFVYKRNGSSWDVTQFHPAGIDGMFTYTPRISSDGTKVLTGGDVFIRYMTWDGSSWTHTQLNPSDESTGFNPYTISSNYNSTKVISGEYAFNHFHLFSFDGTSWTSTKFNTPDVYDGNEYFGSYSAVSDSGVYAVSSSRHKRGDGQYIGEIFIYRE